MARAAAFIDRDGVINADHGYVSRWQDFRILPGVEQALVKLQALDMALVIITNQSGIGRGYYDETAFHRLMQRFAQHLEQYNVQLAGVYFCPHHPDRAAGEYLQACDCRKPAPGMITRACEELELEPAQSIMVGDKPSDVEAGRRAGVARCYQLTSEAPVTGAIAVSSLLDAAEQEAMFRQAAIDAQ